MPSLIYDSARKGVLTGVFNLAADPMWAMLVTPAYVPDPGHATRADVAAKEIAAAGYTAGGKALAGLSVSVDKVKHLAYANASPIEWPSSTAGAGYMVVYKKGATDADSPLLYCLDIARATYSVGFSPDAGYINF